PHPPHPPSFPTRRSSDLSRRSAAEIADLYGVPRERLSVVYNGVDLERFHPKNRAAQRYLARAEAGVVADAWTLLFVGSGFERKGDRKSTRLNSSHVAISY